MYHRRNPSRGGASNPFTGRSLPSPYRQKSPGQHYHGNHQAATLRSIGKKAGLIFVSLVLFFYLMSGGAEEENIVPQSLNSNRDAKKSRRNSGMQKDELRNLQPHHASTKAKESRSKSNPSRDFGGDSVAASGDHNSGYLQYRQDNNNGNEDIGDRQDGLETAIDNSQDARRDVVTPPMQDRSDHSPDGGDVGTALPAGDRSDNNSQDASSLREFGRNSEVSADTIDETAYRKSGGNESSDNAVTTEAAAKSMNRSSSDVGLVNTSKKGLSMEDALNSERSDDNPLESKEDGAAVSIVKMSDPLEIPSARVEGDSGDQASFDRASSDGTGHNLISHGSANTHESHKTNASKDADSMNDRDRQIETEGSAVKSSTVPAKSVDASEGTEDKTKQSADMLEKNSSPLEVPVAEGGDELENKSSTVLVKAIESEDTVKTKQSSDLLGNNETRETNASKDAEDSMNGRDRLIETEESAVKSSTVSAKSVDASEGTEDKTKQSADMLEKNSSPLEVPVAEGGDELVVKSSTILSKAIESEDTVDKTKPSDLLGNTFSPLEIPVATDDSKDQMNGETKGLVDTAATITNRTVPISEASKDAQATESPGESTKEDDKTEVSSQDPPLAKESAPEEVPSQQAYDSLAEARVDSGSKKVRESEDQESDSIESVSVPKQNSTSKDDKPLEEVVDEATTNKDSSELKDINQTSSVRDIEDESQSIDSLKSSKIVANGTATSITNDLSSNEENKTPVQSNSTASETHAANSNSASEDSARKMAEPMSRAPVEAEQSSANTTAEDDPSSIANKTSTSASIAVVNTTATRTAESSRDDTNLSLSNASENRANSTEHLEAVNSTATAMDESNSTTAEIMRQGIIGKVGQDRRQPANEVEKKNSESETAPEQVESDNTEPAKPTTTKKKRKHSLRGAISKKEKAVS